MEALNYRLPDGERTTDVEHYTRDWRALGQAVIRMLGPVPELNPWYVAGFDPGLLVVNRKTHRSMEVDVDLALAIQRHECL